MEDLAMFKTKSYPVRGSRYLFEIVFHLALLALLALTVPADAQQSNPGVQQSGAVTVNDCVKWGPGVGQISSAGAGCSAAPPSAANPTATAGPTAINGAAVTYMRSDAAPAVQKGDNAQFGIVQSDGTTITCTTGLCTVASLTFGGQSVAPGASAVVQGNGGKVQLSTGTATSGNCVSFDANGNTVANGAACATQSNGANPTATASDTAVNGAATTFMRSDAAPAVQKGTDVAFGVVRGNGAQITCVAGVCTTQINSILPTPTRAGDIMYWNGSAWTTLAGNNSGTQVLSENASGVPSWSAAGTGTVTSVTLGAGYGIAVTGTNPVTTSGTFTPAVQLTTVTNSLTGDVALNNASNYFDGPSTAQGSTGTFLATGTVSLIDTAGATVIDCKLWDGTNAAVASARTTVGAAGFSSTISLSGVVASPAGNIRISCKDALTTGAIRANPSGNGNKDSTITVVRIL
jgi:hypothetical protein